MTKKKLLILGGYGNTGRLLARLLLQETDAELILAGRHLEAAQEVAGQLNSQVPGGRVSGAAVDAADPAGLRGALKGIDLLVVASSTARYAGQVAAAALEAGCDYLDIQYSTRKLAALAALAGEIERAGLCFITDGGFHPGLPAALVRAAAGHFDSLEVAKVGSVIKEDWASLDLPPDTTGELLEEINDFQALIFRGGNWQKARLSGMQDTVRMDFGREFGRQICTPMFLEELRALPELYPSLTETGFYVGGFNPVVDWLVLPLAMVGLKLWPRGALRPLGKLLDWSLKTYSRPPYGTLLKVEARGVKDGHPAALDIVLYHPDGYLFTAIPVVACLSQYLDGSIRKPGLWMQANLVEPARLMQDMERLGIEIVVKFSPLAS